MLCFILLHTCSDGSNDHILRKLQAKGAWYLTVLGSLATTQREYVALHAFRHLNMQVQLISLWDVYCFNHNLL